MESKKINRIEFLKNEPKGNTYRKKVKNTKKIFWISQYDPRMAHQRWIISKNYNLLAADPQFSKLFPRKDIISGSRRLKNINEILSPTKARKAPSSEPSIPDSPGPPPPPSITIMWEDGLEPDGNGAMLFLLA